MLTTADHSGQTTGEVNATSSEALMTLQHQRSARLTTYRTRSVSSLRCSIRPPKGFFRPRRTRRNAIGES